MLSERQKRWCGVGGREGGKKTDEMGVEEKQDNTEKWQKTRKQREEDVGGVGVWCRVNYSL